MELQTAIIDVITLTVIALIGWAAHKGATYLKRQGLLAELENKRAYVKIAVHAAEQMFQTADGPKKFDEAKKGVVEYLNEKKIPFTESELDQLIEASVKSMKDGIKKGSA